VAFFGAAIFFVGPFFTLVAFSVVDPAATPAPVFFFKAALVFDDSFGATFGFIALLAGVDVFVAVSAVVAAFFAVAFAFAFAATVNSSPGLLSSALRLIPPSLLPLLPTTDSVNSTARVVVVTVVGRILPPIKPRPVRPPLVV
jgi:hypothetical protein